MTQLEALDKLIEVVEAGTDAPNWHAVAGWSAAKFGYCERAYNGSLDAALALYEALLPGWASGMSMNVHHGYWFAWVQDKDRVCHATAATPARAWLLAILRAYRSVQA